MDESDFMESESKVGYLTFKQNDYIHFDCCMRVKGTFDGINDINPHSLCAIGFSESLPLAFIQITSFSIYGIFEKILTFIVQTGIFGLQQQLALNNVDAESTNCETVKQK